LSEMSHSDLLTTKFRVFLDGKIAYSFSVSTLMPQ
jgi:hypothetical protein